MKKSFKTLLIIFLITFISGGLIALYKSDFYQEKITASTYEFDDQNTSLKTVLINSKNIKFEDKLTIQNKNQLSVTKKMNYYTTSQLEFNISSKFIDGSDCNDFISITPDYKLSQITFSILKDFDKQIRVTLKNDDVEATLSFDYYKTVSSIKFLKDDIVIHLKDENRTTTDNKLITYDNMFKKSFTKFSIDKNNVISFDGNISLDASNIINTNEFIISIIEDELKNHLKSKLKNFFNLSSAEEIWNLSENIIWKEFLKSYQKYEYNMLYITLSGKFYCDGKLLYDNSITNEEVYFNLAIFEFMYYKYFN